jgi:hypothetical protein
MNTEEIYKQKYYKYKSKYLELKQEGGWNTLSRLAKSVTGAVASAVGNYKIKYTFDTLTSATGLTKNTVVGMVGLHRSMYNLTIIRPSDKNLIVLDFDFMGMGTDTYREDIKQEFSGMLGAAAGTFIDTHALSKENTLLTTFSPYNKIKIIVCPDTTDLVLITRENGTLAQSVHTLKIDRLSQDTIKSIKQYFDEKVKNGNLMVRFDTFDYYYDYNGTEYPEVLKKYITNT